LPARSSSTPRLLAKKQVDGDDPEMTTASNGTSAVVRGASNGARVVEELNQRGYHS